MMNKLEKIKPICKVNKFPLCITRKKSVNGFNVSLEAKFITAFSGGEDIIYQITRKTDNPSLQPERVWSVTVNEDCIKIMKNDLIQFFNEYVVKYKKEELISDKSEPSNINILDERKDSNGSEKDLSS